MILTFVSEDEEGGDWVEGDGHLSSLISVRAELARGDLRALYLGWLMCAQSGELDDEDLEPPVPARLSQLSASLESLAEFLRVDPDLIGVAAAASSPLAPTEPKPEDVRARLARVPAGEKDDLLARVKYLDRLEGTEPALWRGVAELVATKQPKRYDEAVVLLSDLRDLGARKDGADFRRRPQVRIDFVQRALRQLAVVFASFGFG